tara:strand:+ start:315 stop:1019 length:705 start_codon:yes stop_codon:yes gene_type:complete
MKNNNIDTALVLAAGFGRRMLPLTKNKPKPLIEVNNRALIDYCINSLKKSGIKKIIVNVHYQSEQIIHYLKKNNPEITISNESKKLLDTGGGIKKALSLVIAKNILVMNSDVLWNNYASRSINSLIAKFDDKNMDSLLLTTKLENADGYSGKGDFIKDSKNLLKRYSHDQLAEPLVYCGMQIINRKQYEKYNSDVFSANKIWDQNIAKKRLFTVVTTKKFNHVGTKDSVIRLNK